jgi:broad specificity phosphatase PhoE
VTRLYLVRHGDATGEGVDSGLSPLGLAQSRLLGERLQDEIVVGVRHSPRRRAVETAVVLGRLCGTPMVADPLLDDRTPVPAEEEMLYPGWTSGWFAGVPDDERDEGVSFPRNRGGLIMLPPLRRRRQARSRWVIAFPRWSVA